MKKQLQTSLIGSWPRSQEVLKAKKLLDKNLIKQPEYDKLIFDETKRIVDIQEELNLDIITSGELSRDNFVSFIGEKIEGVKIMSMSEMLEFIDDKSAFEEILTTLDVPSLSIKNAICVGKIKYNKSLVEEEVKILKKITKKPIKITLPGPYLMTRSMWLPNISLSYYKNKDELAVDVITILKKEIDNLIDLKVDYIQFDEPVLTEVVFSAGKTRTFMCSALSEKKDPTQELSFATKLLKEIFEYCKDKKITTALHVCRGNWSKDEKTLLSGSYTPLIPVFQNINPDILNLEFSTPRAGEINVIFDKLDMSNTILGLGVINPRTDEIEDSSKILEFVKNTLQFTNNEHLYLNPDCGFATFANRPVSVEEIIRKKISAFTNVAKQLKMEKK